MVKIQVGGGTSALLTSDAVPDSKIHADPQPPAYDWSLFSINGQPIPEELWPNMNYHLTDQARAERDKARGPQPLTEFVRDEADKKNIDGFRDTLQSGSLRGRDPLRIAMDKYLPKGMRGLWIGAKKAEEAGLVRGGLEYIPVLVDDPDNAGKKKRVTQNGMFLAMCSTEAFEMEQREIADINEEKQRVSVERVQEQADQLLDRQGMRELAGKRRIDSSLLSGNIEVDEGESADRELASMVDHEVGSD